VHESRSLHLLMKEDIRGGIEGAARILEHQWSTELGSADRCSTAPAGRRAHTHRRVAPPRSHMTIRARFWNCPSTSPTIRQPRRADVQAHPRSAGDPPRERRCRYGHGDEAHARGSVTARSPLRWHGFGARMVAPCAQRGRSHRRTFPEQSSVPRGRRAAGRRHRRRTHAGEGTSREMGRAGGPFAPARRIAPMSGRVTEQRGVQHFGGSRARRRCPAYRRRCARQNPQVTWESER